MKRNEDNFIESGNLRTRMDAITAAMVVIAALLALTLTLLWLAYSSNAERLDIIERAIQLTGAAR
jgi:hypothetical protein